MTNYRVRFTPEAKEDIQRLYQFMLDQSSDDLLLAHNALKAIGKGIDYLMYSPYSCRKVYTNNPYLRETVIPFGSSGYTALFEIEAHNIVTILAIRHQREDDYY